MSEIRGVIFDLDGCLVDSEPLSLEAIASEMRACGLADATAQEIGEKFLGVAMPVITAYVSERLGAPAPVEFAIRVESRLLATYRTELRQIPGAEDLLGTLQENGIGRAIATGGSLRRMAATLEISGLKPWFDGTASSAEEVPQGKPAPDIFYLARDRLRQDTAGCLVLDDSPHGIRGARAAGIQAIGFVGGSHLEGHRSDHAATLREAGAEEVFERLEDVASFVSAGSS